MNNATFLRAMIYQDYTHLFLKISSPNCSWPFYFSDPAPAVIAGKHQLFQRQGTWSHLLLIAGTAGKL